MSQVALLRFNSDMKTCGTHMTPHKSQEPSKVQPRKDKRQCKYEINIVVINWDLGVILYIWDLSKKVQPLLRVYSESIQPCNMKNKDIYWRRYKKHCTQNNDASVPFRVTAMGPQTFLPIVISCPVIFSCIWLTVWNFFSFKGYF